MRVPKIAEPDLGMLSNMFKKYHQGRGEADRIQV